MRKKVLVSIMISGFKIWTQVRDEEGPLYGKLEFPGGKIEAGESPEEAVVREVHEEVGVLLTSNDKKVMFKIQDYSNNERDIVLYVFISNFDQLPNDKGEWLTISNELKSSPYQGKIPPINHVIIDELAVYLEKFSTSNKQELLDRIWITSKP